MGGYVNPTATIVRGSEHAPRLAEQKRRQENDKFVFMGDANLTHKPQFYVGIFNVSGIEQKIERPWVHPQRGGRMILVQACPHGKKHSEPFVIPDIVQMPEEQPGSWRVRTYGQDGRFLAQDALNPEDPTGNWRTMREIGAGIAANEGTNLYQLGCFWITAPTKAELVPNEEEVNTAHTRLEKRFNALIEEANTFQMAGGEFQRQIGWLHRTAANYFGIDAPWNKRYTRRVACPNCDEANSPNAAVCINERCNTVFSWENAIKRGLRTIEQARAAGIIVAQAESFLAEQEAEAPARVEQAGPVSAKPKKAARKDKSAKQPAI